jgi:aspartyl-tRNA(Asn)/glutamyl-tRNA(Gln) amidotransferase subunit B
LFEAVISNAPARVKGAANWILGDVLANSEFQISALHLAELIDLVLADEVSSKSAKEIFSLMVSGETGSPREIADRHNMKQVTDTAAIEAAIDKLMAANSAMVEQYRGGKTGLLGFFVGNVMKATGGAANPKVVSEIVAKKLG